MEHKIVDSTYISRDHYMMPVVESRPGTRAIDRKLFAVTWPMIVIAALMLSLCIASLTTLSSIRAFVNGEGMWSKAERQAIAELRHYGRSGRQGTIAF